MSGDVREQGRVTRGGPLSCPRGAWLLQRGAMWAALPAGPGSLPALPVPPRAASAERRQLGWAAPGSLEGTKEEASSSPLFPLRCVAPVSPSHFRGGIPGWSQVLAQSQAETGVVLLSVPVARVVRAEERNSACCSPCRRRGGWSREPGG